ncbi:MAG TPA: hypothetical protein VEU29_04060 [Actinomycetota bacterium]|nr:hypothetical protein [Actinomycetota bacterium]
MTERDDLLARIAELHHELPKLFAWELYELPDDVRAYYISDRPHPDATAHGYHLQLFLLRSTTFTWISLEFYDHVVDRRHIHTMPLHRIRSVRSYQYGTPEGSGMGCSIDLGEIKIDLPFEGDPRSAESPASHRAFAFGKAVADAI